MSRTPKGPYTVWTDHGYDGWSPTDYETLDEAIAHESYGSEKHISKPVKFTVVDQETDNVFSS
jgi:hypothetical protein